MTQPVAIITGGAQGIGKVIAATLANNGYQVVIFDIDTEAGQETAAEINDLLFIECDVAKEKAVARAVEEVIERFHRLDVLVNNAGIGITKPVEELQLAEWNKVIGINLTGAFLCAKYCTPALRDHHGCIINIASTRAYMSEANTEAYSASKGGILAITHALAISLGPDIRVNAISPGWIDVTPYQKRSVRQPEQLRQEDHTQHPAGRVGMPQDIARLIAFLVDPSNDFITGQDFVVDGGMTRKMIYV